MRSTPPKSDYDRLYERNTRRTMVRVADTCEERSPHAHLLRELIPEWERGYSPLLAIDISLRSLKCTNPLPYDEDVTVETLQGWLAHRLNQLPAPVEVSRAYP